MDKQNDISGFQENGPEESILKRQRKKLGYTQQQVADLASIDIRLYQRLESEERKISRASFRTGVAIADVLKLDVHDLVYTDPVHLHLQNKQKMAQLQKEGKGE